VIGSKGRSNRAVAALAIALVVVAAAAATLAAFAFCGPVTRGAQLNSWPESRIAYPGARLVATETKDKAPESWLGGNQYNDAALIKTYEVDASVANISVVGYYSRQLSAFGWHDNNGNSTVTPPAAAFCKPPNMSAFITFPATLRFAYALQDVSANVVCGP
jgi:hypothetical protein